MNDGDKKGDPKNLLFPFGILALLFVLIIGYTVVGNTLREVGFLPTLAPKPTATPSPPPTKTPIPTDTATPTDTPPPTDTLTPTPPPDTPTPVVTATPAEFSGNGDSIVDVAKSNEPMIAIIQGNSEGRLFAVTSLDANNQHIALLVNTTDPYFGVRPVDFRTGELTTRFEVKAIGGWSIDLLPLTSANKLNVPSEIKGSGDDVLILTGGIPDIAAITGNSSSRLFAVVGYGSRSDLLVNTTDPYQGQVILNPDTLVLVITAMDEWSIAIAEK